MRDYLDKSSKNIYEFVRSRVDSEVVGKPIEVCSVTIREPAGQFISKIKTMMRLVGLKSW